jgi:hypothetical protein
MTPSTGAAVRLAPPRNFLRGFPTWAARARGRLSCDTSRRGPSRILLMGQTEECQALRRESSFQSSDSHLEDSASQPER